VHTHRLRALFDAVVVGARTVRTDDPQLTTREVEGPSPVRVVLDTDRRLDARYRVFRDDPETLLLCAADAGGEDCLGRARVLRLPRAREGLDIPAVLGALAARGLRRIFVEGGGITVSRFLAAGALDRLHVTIAPLVIGSGIPSFTLPQASNLAEVPRFDWTLHRLGADILVDIPLSRSRPRISD
jgi:riboflavin-specific deaminase-like protein